MCTRPNIGGDNPDGGRPIFGYEAVRRGLTLRPYPCGACPECTSKYYKSWALRGHRELLHWDSLGSSSIFLTLTYNDENLPEDKSLDKKAVQNFLKRVKKHFGSTKSNPIRQIYCGEYGTDFTRRPHYHAVLFNCDFGDGKFHRYSDQGLPIFTSATLSRLWPYGFSEYGFADAGAIGYIYKYILKKKTRREKKKPLSLDIDGVTYDVAHEFVEGSRNPGIGAYFRTSSSIKKGFLSLNGVVRSIPKYYLEWLRVHDPHSYDKISNQKFDFMSSQPNETALRRSQKEMAQKLLTDTKRKL